MQLHHITYIHLQQTNGHPFLSALRSEVLGGHGYLLVLPWLRYLQQK
jgi:hypothetical protein